MSEQKNTRRNLLRGTAAAVAGAAVAATAVTKKASAAESAPVKKLHYKGAKPTKASMFSSAVSYGNLLFIAGKGAHYKGDIKAHTKTVLDDIEQELINAGSSMDKVLKVNVYLSKAEDFQAMGEVYKGRFGDNPPVRTTIAAAWIPGDSLVEIDVIAFI